MKWVLSKHVSFIEFCIVHRRSISIIEKYQSKKVNQLIRHIIQHVPIWQRRSLKVREMLLRHKGLELLSMMPLTNKESYIGKMTEEYIDSSRYFPQRSHTTSGTTGQPFKFFFAQHSISERFYNDFASFRFLWWLGKPLRNIQSTKVAQIKQTFSASNTRLYIPFSSFQADRRAVYAQIAEFEPDILVAYPSVLFDIARMIEQEKKLPLLAPRYVLSSGEMLAPAVRSFVSTKLQTEVYNRYALEEVGVVGTECSLHDGFHVNAESIVVEITDESGRPVSVGQQGKVVITDLHNYNMPFIRYDTGDKGYLSSVVCGCGLHTPRLWVEGRVSVYLTFGRRRIHCLEFDSLDGFMHEIFQYQLAKQSETQILLRIVPGPAWRHTTEARIRDSLRNLLQDQIDLMIQLVDHIPQTIRGKTNLIVDETKIKAV